MRIHRRNLCATLAAAVLLAVVTAPVQGSDADMAVATFRQGVAQYKAKEFVVAKSTFQKVARDQLSPADQADLDEYLSTIDLAIRRQAAAMNAYEAAVKATRAGELVAAKEQFQIAAESEFLPEAVRRDARAQLALVTKQVAAMPPAPPPPPPATQPAAPTVRMELPPTTQPAATQPAALPGGMLDRRAKADVLLAEGKQALAANDPARAAITLEQALTFAPELEEARDLLVGARAQSQARTAETTGPLTVLEQRRQIKRQQTDVEFDTALKRASDLLGTAGTAVDFDAAAEAARRAENVIQVNRDLYSVGEYRDRLAEVARRLDGIHSRRSEWERDQVRKQLDEMAEAEGERVRRVQEQLGQQVTALIEQARTLREEQKYAQSLEVVQQILRLDPTNPWAGEHQQILQQLMLVNEQQAVRREDWRQEEGALRDARESATPWYDPIVFPRNWREQAQRREGRGTPALGWEEDRRIREVLRQGLKNPLDLELEVGLGEVLQQLEKDMGISIRVKWKQLETLAYSEEGTKVGPMRLSRVTNDKALRVILEDASGTYVGDPNELSYVVDNGELTISTKQDLSRLVTTPEVMHVRVYDTRDLLRGWAWATRSFTALGVTGIPQGAVGAGEAAGTGVGTGAGIGTGGAGITGAEANVEGAEPNNVLIGVIRSAVDPSSWDPSGPGRVSIWDDRLVVRQTAANHAAIGDLIAQLRQAKEIQVTIDAKFVRVATGYLETIISDLDFRLNFNTGHLVGTSAGGLPLPGILPLYQGSSSFVSGVSNVGLTGIADAVTSPALSSSGVAYLDDIQVNFLLEATQAHEDTRTLNAPRLTLMSGTQAQMWVGETRQFVTDYDIEVVEPNFGPAYVTASPVTGAANYGTMLSIDAAVSGDLKYVTLRIRPWINTLIETREVDVTVEGASGPLTFTLELPQTDIQTLDTTVTVPDGGTLLLGGLKKFAQAEREMGVPILSKIPIINRAFANRAKVKDDSTLLILVKPTIIVPRDEETRMFPTFP